MTVDGHEAIIGCGCGSAACLWSVLTLQPRECSIFPMLGSEDGSGNALPPRDGQFPLLSIIHGVHFESPSAERPR